jgi:cytochrome c peroxidase
LSSLGACRRSPPPPPPKPTIEQAWAAAKLPRLSRVPVIPARRTNVLPVPPRQGPPDDPVLVALGKKIFFDTRLSEPPGTACSSCHDPAHAFSGEHTSRVGVPQGSRPGHFARRSTPSVLYMRYIPAFHYFEDDENPAPEPRGGFFWDGRSDSLVELVKQPLFNPDEMNAGTPRRLADKIVHGPYAGEFRAALGGNANPDAVLHGVGVALEAFLKSDEMTPATSKYDAYVRGQATLTEPERRGLEVFMDRRRGACAGCHRMAETSSNPADSMFTDFSYDAIGLPRNRELPASHVPASYDLGLCARQNKTTPSSDERFCGAFRTPSLRNVAVRESFGHNGVHKHLRDVLSFYNLRASFPGRIYPQGQKFDDVPPRYRGNVNIYSPIYNRREGSPPPMSEQDMDDLTAFLNTLTDARFLPAAPADAPIAAQSGAQSPRP